MRAGGAALLAGAMAACSPSSPASPPSDAGPDDGEPCATGFLGDPSGTPDLQILALHADDSVVPVADGDRVPMIFPPQGGRVIFVGVRATNIDGCAVQLQGALRDLATQQVRFDQRTVNLTPTGDGWGTTGQANEPLAAAISDFSNVPLCPNEWSQTNLYGNAYGLEVTVQDRGGRMLTKTLHVVPECGEPSNLAACLCICKAGYVLGQACPDDGGAPTDARSEP
jgi:hypothetical protein